MQPWSRLSTDLAGLLRPALPEVVSATVAAIAAEVPAYAGAVDTTPVVRRGTQLALTRLLDLFGTDSPALDAGAARFYRRIGAGESQQGRSMEALLAAYRVGARVAWQQMSARAVSGGVSTDDLVGLAEAIFVYIDELSGASAQGHASRAGLRDVQRSRLVQALLDGAALTDPVGVRAEADAAGWTLPQRLAVAVVPLPPGREPTPPADVLALIDGDEALAILPDPSGPGRRAALERAWEGSQVFVGTVRPAAQAPISLAHARRVQRLVGLGRIPSTQVVAAADHLPELVIAADTDLLSELSDRVLAPLTGLSAGKRRALQETLTAWLAFQGDRTAVAEHLHVHPQTVSYRQHRLRELFGSALDDPHQRLALQLVLGTQSSGSVR
ncbi:MAG: helix-turn-helix domain-containing protein [Candidatus Nanopelagicales bacterium]